MCSDRNKNIFHLVTERCSGSHAHEHVEHEHSEHSEHSEHEYEYN